VRLSRRGIYSINQGATVYGARFAEESEGQIISGQNGYKLTIETTVTEIAETAWLKSQGQKMIRRWLAIQKVAHPTLAGAGAARAI
jgi:hypothetical protein